jgi:MFS family permease
LQILLTAAITTAILGGYLGGRMVDHYGPRRLLHGVLYTWMLAMGIGVIAGAAEARSLAWLVGGLGGLALGATWAADRVYMQRIPAAISGVLRPLCATVDALPLFSPAGGGSRSRSSACREVAQALIAFWSRRGSCSRTSTTVPAMGTG